jgi:hypothetical protein
MRTEVDALCAPPLLDQNLTNGGEAAVYETAALPTDLRGARD